MDITLSFLLLVLLEAVAFYFAFLAVRNSRTPQGSVAWVVFLLTAPFLAVPAYLVLGHKRFNGYVVARREAARVIEGQESARKLYPPRGDTDGVGYQAFEAIAASPILSGNNIDLLIDGDQIYNAFFEAIDNAKSYLLVQFYILRDDSIGQALADRLKTAAARGVTVRMLYDSVGSSRLTRRYVQDLSEAGIEILNSNELRGPSSRLQINFRNHRKTLVADGKVGFVGGANIGDEYLGRDKEMGAWRDTHCRLTGPIVAQLQLVFCEDWFWATEEILLDDLHWRPVPAPENLDALLLATGPADPLESGNLYFTTAIGAARERVWIASPYFVPDRDIMTALSVAALRGVDVRILVPDVADHWATYLAAFDYFDDLQDVGVQFWRFENGFMHQKVLLIDNSIASVGTMNLDARSCRLNFEATAVFFDEQVAGDVETMLRADFEQSRLYDQRLSDQPLWIRLGAPVARLFAPLL